MCVLMYARTICTCVLFGITVGLHIGLYLWVGNFTENGLIDPLKWKKFYCFGIKLTGICKTAACEVRCLLNIEKIGFLQHYWHST